MKDALTKDIDDMESKYYSFLVRLWESENDGDSTWRISLESSESGEMQYFTSLGELLNFFENLMRANSVSSGSTEGADQ
jgi:hypothetical protein